MLLHVLYTLNQVLPELSDNECDDSERLAAYMELYHHLV